MIDQQIYDPRKDYNQHTADNIWNQQGPDPFDDKCPRINSFSEEIPGKQKEQRHMKSKYKSVDARVPEMTQNDTDNGYAPGNIYMLNSIVPTQKTILSFSKARKSVYLSFHLVTAISWLNVSKPTESTTSPFSTTTILRPRTFLEYSVPFSIIEL